MVLKETLERFRTGLNCINMKIVSTGNNVQLKKSHKDQLRYYCCRPNYFISWYQRHCQQLIGSNTSRWVP